MTNLELLRMRQERYAWRQVVHEWPGDMNDPKWNPLVDAIRVWGERLAILRDVQTDEQRATALARTERQR